MAKTEGIRIPKGFRFGAAEAGIRYRGRVDMGLIYSETEAVAAGVFTRNRVKAAPVRLGQRQARSGRGQAIVVNSGNANACTGTQGMDDAVEMSRRTAELLGIRPSRAFVCSTGVIGTPLPMVRVRRGIDRLVHQLGNHSLEDVARAMMTTDTFPKVASRQVRIGKESVTIAACAKGAGMIRPDMATMLCFVITDAAVERKAMRYVLKTAVESTFNSITVDGDMSTNDTVLVLANGTAGNIPVRCGTGACGLLEGALVDMCGELAEMMVRDGEGATKIVEVEVRGAASVAEAKKAAGAVANSLLVKTALYGNDANWGRIIAAVGYSGVRFSPEKVDIFFDRLQVVKGGLSTNSDARAGRLLKKKKVKIAIDLHCGTASTRILTCDLTEEYIRINAEYRT